MVDEFGVEKPLQSAVYLVPADGERLGHSLATEERRATSVGGERQQHEHRRSMWPELGEPASVQQLCLQPAEGTIGSPVEIGTRRRQGWSPVHGDLFFFDFSARSFAFCSARSSASFLR